jgi:serine/threonine protein kinase
LPDYFDGWEILGEQLGKGGQGTVYLARSPERALEVRHIKERIGELLRIAGLSNDVLLLSEFAQRIVEAGSSDPLASLGALKQFAIPTDDKKEEKRAVGRLESEVRALEKVNHPAVLKLLHSNVVGRFIVTEYHQRGSLRRNLSLYRGEALAALEAFRWLVDGVCEIHKQGAIHRDIKPKNIFVADSGRLVLGDFGIVFFEDRTRITATFERVGSRDWMAPWAYRNDRLEMEEIKPSLDIFPLAKVLWAMISGRDGFPFWEYDRDENNLEKIVPHDPMMPLVNQVLAKCIVREDKDCRLSAKELLAEIDGLIDRARSVGRKPDQGPWPCRMCGKGYYSERGHISPSLFYRSLSGEHKEFTIHTCDHCGHTEMFMKEP